MEKKKTFDVKSLLKISSNNKKLLGMLILVIIVLSIATGGSFAKIGQFQLIAYLFPEMGVLALGMMLAGALGMKLVPAEYFGVVERFSVFAATGFNAALGLHLFCSKLKTA